MIQLSICGTAHGWAGMQHMSGRCLISICVLLGDVRVLMGAVRRSRPSRYLPKMGRLKEINASNIQDTDTPIPSRSCGKLLLWSRTKNRHPIWLWGGLVRLYYIVGHCTWFQYKAPLPAFHPPNPPEPRTTPRSRAQRAKCPNPPEPASVRDRRPRPRARRLCISRELLATAWRCHAWDFWSHRQKDGANFLVPSTKGRRYKTGPRLATHS